MYVLLYMYAEWRDVVALSEGPHFSRTEWHDLDSWYLAARHTSSKMFMNALRAHESLFKAFSIALGPEDGSRDKQTKWPDAGSVKHIRRSLSDL